MTHTPRWLRVQRQARRERDRFPSRYLHIPDHYAENMRAISDELTRWGQPFFFSAT